LGEKIARKFWSSKRILTFFLILFGIFVGMLVQHYYLEPLLSNGCIDDLRFCKTQVSVLDEENSACYQQNYDLDRRLNYCERDLELYRQQEG
jgi:hypothetical protein